MKFSPSVTLLAGLAALGAYLAPEAVSNIKAKAVADCMNTQLAGRFAEGQSVVMFNNNEGSGYQWRIVSSNNRWFNERQPQLQEHATVALGTCKTSRDAGGLDITHSDGPVYGLH